MNKRIPWAWLFISLSSALSLWSFPRYTIGLFEDDAAYLLGAFSLAKGQYLDLSFSRPVPISTSFPGVSLFLTPFVWIFSSHLGFYKLVPWIASFCSALFFSKITAKVLTSWRIPLCIALFILNPMYVQSSSFLMTEPFNIALMLGALWGGGRDEEKGWGFFLALVAVVLLALTRPEGILVGLVLSMAWAYDRRWKRSLAFFVGGLLPFLLAHGRSWIFESAPGMYENHFRAHLSWEGQHMSLFGIHIFELTLSIIKNTVAAYSRVFDPLSMGLALALAVAALIFFGIRHLGGSEKRPTPFLMALVSLPFSQWVVRLWWFQYTARYTLIFTPFLLIFLFAGIENLFEESRRTKTQKRWIPVVVFAFFLIGLANAWKKRPAYPPLPEKTLAWAKTHLPKEANVLSGRKYLVRLYAGKPGFYFEQHESWDLFQADLLEKRISHLFFAPTEYLTAKRNIPSVHDPSASEIQTKHFLKDHPHRFKKIFDQEDEKTVVYEWVPENGFSKAWKDYQNALTLYQKGKPMEALRCVEKTNAAPGTLASALNLEALLIQDLPQRASEAQGLFERAIEKDPTSKIYRANAARLYFKRGKESDGKRELDKLMELTEKMST
ncbi:MAG: hypothetical protein IPP35_03790 [Elusimicrobia bacterium]|nr:hypothetical protein [Elusimicrobiota bacterium]